MSYILLSFFFTNVIYHFLYRVLEYTQDALILPIQTNAIIFMLINLITHKKFKNIFKKKEFVM